MPVQNQQQSSPIAISQREVAFVFASTLLLASAMLFSLGATAQTFSVIHTFSDGQDGAYPYAGLVTDKKGNLYGAANQGGDLKASCPPANNGCGTIFKLAPSKSGWKFQPIYVFRGGKNGQGPYGRVAFGPDGKLYGTTVEGGNEQPCSSGCGSVFRLKPPLTCHTQTCPWTETVLYRFLGNTDGFYPTGDLTFDQAGNLYGTTFQGGTYGPGTVYELKKGSWAESIVWNFTGNSDGGNPYSGVIFDEAGNIYTSALAGGLNNGGAVLELSPSESDWTETTLYDFYGTSGVLPFAGLVLNGSGNVIGATESGGPNANGGTVYELSPSGGTWNLTTLYNFTGEGEPGPWGKLTMDAAGNLYGTTQGYPGAGDWGTAFKLTLSNGVWTETVLHRFTGGKDGGYPLSNLVLDSTGNLYGTTNLGGKGYGVVFQIAP
jgi:uncharacterized repeat protein (TIGR03803 family)